MPGCSNLLQAKDIYSTARVRTETIRDKVFKRWIFNADVNQGHSTCGRSSRPVQVK